MEPKRQRAIWAGAGLFFVVGVGSGYIPELMLNSEMAAARKEGLIQPVSKLPSVPSSKNAYVRYREIQVHDAQAMARLRSAPTNAVSHPEVRKMLREYAEASKRPVYWEPLVETSPALGSPLGNRDVPFDVSFASLILAREADTAEDLVAAARMANHVRTADLAEIPSLAWPKTAERALDRAATLKLSPDDRSKLIAALGPSPGLPSQLRLHVIAVLQKLNHESKTGPHRLTREKLGFLKFWRGFLRTVPKEPKAFAAAVAAAEPKMIAADEGVGIYRDYASPSANPWKDWAQAMARILPRLRQGAK